ncbi:hypothetical protein AEQU3_02620 [Aequorivita antarctica]|nr:hypothetical protein AEQU3_02620 [Aequorivita antarctica]
MIYREVKSSLKASHKIQSSKIPKYPISQEKIDNTKLLTDREELLKYLPKEGIVCELGVDKGDFSELILKYCKPKKLHLVDLWGSERYSQNKKRDVEEKFKSQIDSGKVQIDIGYSTDVGKTYEDNYFDWIYIDTDHSYEGTFNELETYRLKVKDNGIIAGHDYVIANWDGMIRYGVIEAVYEFCSKYNWELIYITMELNNPSFAIRKLKKITDQD